MNAQPNRSLFDRFLAHFVISAGGSRSILAGCGSAFACNIAGIEWLSIGGVSGGSIPAVLLASGMKPAQLLRFALEVNFHEKCVATASKLETLLALLMKEYHEHPENRSAYGVMETEKLGEFIDELVPTWPEKFWTMAVDGDLMIVFNKDGIFEYGPDGKCTQLSNKPAQVGFAIRATCSIPGVTKPPKLGERYLYDGAFSKYGMCPVALPIRHFGAAATSIIGLCVGEDLMTGITGYLRSFWKWVWAIPPDPSWGPHTDGVIGIHPHIDHIHALRFQLSADEKWLAILAGFAHTVHELASRGILQGERLHKALTILASLPNLKKVVPAKKGKPQKLALKAEHCFAAHGLI